MSKFSLLIATGMIALCAATAASAADEKLELTIYGDGRTLIDDVRDVRFNVGEQSIVLPGVSSAILPQSVTIRSDDIEILEQNFDFDLLTPAKLMEKAVGETVELVRINPATGAEERRRAKVLSVNNGTVIEVDGKIEVLRADQVPTRVIFPEVPENLRAEPTLSLKLDTNRPGTRSLGLSYLSSGITWEADYVMSFDEATNQMDLQGWATLENLTQTRFEDADISVIAGYVGTLNGRNNYGYNNQNEYFRFYFQHLNQVRNIVNQRRNTVRQGGTEASSQERVGDNLIYRLPNKTTLAANQKKQIALVEANGVAAEKVYEFYQGGFSSNGQPQSVDSRISFSNSRATGLGEALPAGTIRVYTKDQNGKSQFIGEESIGHIAGGSDMSLKIGEAFDITVKPTLVKTEKVSDKITEYEMKFDLKNASEKDVTVRLHQNMWGTRIEHSFLRESQTGEMKNANQRVWDVAVPAEGSAKLTYKVREDRR
jgi:hypothetical protein